MQELKELIKLSNLCNFQLFASSIEGNIRHQKLRNCWVAKKLMSRTSPVKFRVFRREFLRKHLMNWTQIFSEKLNCYALSVYRVFILLASSDSDKHMLRTVPTIVIAHTFCASPDTQISYRQCLLIQGYFCAV